MHNRQLYFCTINISKHSFKYSIAPGSVWNCCNFLERNIRNTCLIVLVEIQWVDFNQKRIASRKCNRWKMYKYLAFISSSIFYFYYIYSLWLYKENNFLSVDYHCRSTYLSYQSHIISTSDYTLSIRHWNVIHLMAR